MKLYFAICCIIYCLCAVFANAFGITSPDLQAFLGTTETQQGLIVTFQSIGGLLAAIFLALYGERFNKIKTIAVGTAAVAVSALLVGLLPCFFSQESGRSFAYNLLFIVLAIGGIGNSTVDLTMNGMVADLYSKSKGLHIPVIHTFYGAGAMITPIIFMCSIPLWTGAPRFSTPYLIIALVGLTCFAAYAFSAKKVIPLSPYADMRATRQLVCHNPAEVFTSLRSWALIFIAFLYAAFQYGLSIWLSTYNIQQVGLSQAHSGYVVSAYFSVALVMRLFSPKILTRLSASKYYAIFGIAASISLSAAFCSSSSAVFIIFLLLGGFLQGGLVPCFMIIASDALPNRQSAAAAFFLIAMNLAGLLVPLIMGVIIEHISFRLAMLFIIFCLFLSAAFLNLRGKTVGQRN